MTGLDSLRTMKRAASGFAVTLVIIAGVGADEVLRVSPADSMSALGDRLATDPEIAEVILAAGTYRDALTIRELKGSDPADHPLLIRAADGARVTFAGDRRLARARPVKGIPGVFSVVHRSSGGEFPKLWEPDARVRYLLTAGIDAVARFPASYTFIDGRIYFHTSDSLPPGDRVIAVSAGDYGIWIGRSNVTVRDIEFRNHLAREKMSAGVFLAGDRITVEHCSTANASMGFVILGDHGAVVGSTARDVGGGVYIAGREARVEGCRFFKERGAFMVPTYAQDDSGIQFYYPARSGVVRDNLVVGFDKGILIKAPPSPYVIEHNTLVGAGLRAGFLLTGPAPDLVFAHNIAAGFKAPVERFRIVDGQVFGHNCYYSPDRPTFEPLGEGSIVADPQFRQPSGEDYRLGPESGCMAISDEAGPGGALTAALPEGFSGGEPREWHVSPGGRDGQDASAASPVRTVQFAIDRAAPGDTILLHPGLYTEPITIRRGGIEGKPITLRAVEPWTAVLDAGRRADTLIDAEGAPFIAIRDLEIRWYRRAGISLVRSPNATISGCRIWNAHWRGAWPTGNAIEVRESPGFTGHRNILFRQEFGFWLYHSPGATLTDNTCTANLYAAVNFIRSSANSICRNNSFAFQGNDVIVVAPESDDTDALATFDCDYNNYGTYLGDEPGGGIFDRIVPREEDRHLLTEGKAIVRYIGAAGRSQRFRTMEAWRSFSGLDRHSIFADPLYLSSVHRDFRLEPSSPNIGAGENGTTIGALKAAE